MAHTRAQSLAAATPTTYITHAISAFVVIVVLVLHRQFVDVCSLVRSFVCLFGIGNNYNAKQQYFIVLYIRIFSSVYLLPFTWQPLPKTQSSQSATLAPLTTQIVATTTTITKAVRETQQLAHIA